MAKKKSLEEKQEAIERLEYEIRMLCRTALFLNCNLKRKRPKVIHNALIHSFLIAVRNLCEFFFNPSENNGKISAKSFVASWHCQAPKFKEHVHWSKLDSDKKTPKYALDHIISQRLHHITWARVNESKLDWHEPEIAKEFLRPIEKFQSDLPPELQSDTFDAKVRELQRICNRLNNINST